MHQLVPRALRLVQGGQQEFIKHQLRAANTAAAEARKETAGSMAGDTARAVSSLPTADFAAQRVASEPVDPAALGAGDAFDTRRMYNELAAYEEYKASQAEPEAEVAEGEEDPLPDSIVGAAYFEDRFGYSLVKDRSALHAPDTRYAELDLWGELPKYGRGTYFLYLVSRRRNVYAVMYDFDGKRVHPTYSAGNRGLKGTEKGFKAEGSAETGHIVTSQYLNEVIPKVREAEMEAGRMRAGDSKKIPVVLRVLGFYNGRQGAVRAVTDRSDVFDVRHFEDITPFPLNGPKMPKAHFG